MPTKTSASSLKSILLHLHETPIAFYRCYARLVGSAAGGLLLSQILYHWGSFGGRKFWKTDAALQEETCLSEHELKKAKAAIRKLDFITVTREGIPAKTYYAIDEAALAAALGALDLPAPRSPDDTPEGPPGGEPKADISRTSSETLSELDRRPSPNWIGDPLRTTSLDSSLDSGEDSTPKSARAVSPNWDQDEDKAKIATKPLRLGKTHACTSFQPGFPCEHEKAALDQVEQLWDFAIDGHYNDFRHANLHAAVHKLDAKNIEILLKYWKKTRQRYQWSVAMAFARPVETLAQATAPRSTEEKWGNELYVKRRV